MKVFGFPQLFSFAMFAYVVTALCGGAAGAQEANESSPGAVGVPAVFRPNETELTIDQWRPGTYSLKAFLRPRGGRQPRIAPDGAAGRVQSRPNLNLIVDPRSNRGQFSIPLQAFGLDKYCCADNFDELQITFRDLNLNNRVRIGVTALYSSPVALGENAGANAGRKTFIATSGIPDEKPRMFSSDFQLTELRWVTRDYLYPVRRILGLPDSGTVYLTSLQGQTLAQLRPDLNLGSAGYLQLELGNCAPLEDLHFRIGYRNTSALVTRVQDIDATSTLTPGGSVLTLNIARIRERLGLKPRESVRIAEIFADFASSKEALAVCRPLKSIRYDAPRGGDEQVESMILPYEVTSTEQGLQTLRIRQSALADFGKWGRVLGDLTLRLKEADPRQLSGIELVNVRYASSAEEALPFSRPGGCIDPVATMQLDASATGLDSACADEMQRVNFAALSVARNSAPSSKFGVTVDVRGEGAGFRLGAGSSGLHLELVLPNVSSSATMRLDALGASDVVRRVTLGLYFSDTITASIAGNPDRLLKSGENEIIVPAGEALTFLFTTKSVNTQLSLAFVTISGIAEASYGSQRLKVRHLSWKREEAAIVTDESNPDLPADTPRHAQSASYLRYYAPGSEVCYGFSGTRLCAPGNLDVAEIVSSDGLHLKGEDSRWIRLKWDGTIPRAQRSAVALSAISRIPATALNVMIDSATFEWRDAANIRHEIPLRLNALVPLPPDHTEMKDITILLRMRSGAFDFFMSELRILALRSDGSGDPVRQKVAVDAQRALRPAPVEHGNPSLQVLPRDDQLIFFRNEPGWGKAVSLQWTMPLNVRRSELVGILLFAAWPAALMETDHTPELIVRGREHSVRLPLRLDPAQQYYSIRSSELFPVDFPLDEELVALDIRITPNKEYDRVFGEFFGQFAVKTEIRAVVPAGEGMPDLPLVQVGGTEIQMPKLSTDQLRTLLTKGGWIDLGTWNSGSGQTVRRLQHPIFEVDRIRLDPMK
jgi:hypothetical protein